MENIGDMNAIAVNIFGIRQLPILKRVHQRNVNHHTGIRRELGNVCYLFVMRFHGCLL